jgi:hypothetical protein
MKKRTTRIESEELKGFRSALSNVARNDTTIKHYTRQPNVPLNSN